MTVLKRTDRLTDRLVDATHPESAPDSVVSEPELANFLAYWRSLLPNAAWPRRADLDPIEMPRLLPFVMITKTTPEGGEQIRLAGTHIVDHLGFDPTGGDLTGATAAPRFAGFCRTVSDTVTEARAPVYAGAHHVSGRGAMRHASQIACPLSDSGGSIDATVRCLRFDPANDPDPMHAGDPIAFVCPLVRVAV